MDNQEVQTAIESPAENSLLESLKNSIRSGANWFYWIAGLSLVNTAFQLFGSDRSFVIGLAATQFVDFFAKAFAENIPRAGTLFIVLGVVVDLLIAGILILFGWQAGKMRRWAFVTGMILYSGDTLLLLLVQDWMSLAFHGFALFSIGRGFLSLRKYAELEIREGLRPVGSI